MRTAEYGEADGQARVPPLHHGPLEPVEIGRFEEQAARRRQVISFTPNPLPVPKITLLDQSAVSEVGDGCRHELVGRQEVGQDTLGAAVVLDDATQEKALVELVTHPGIEDVHIEDIIAGRGAIKPD